MDLCTPNGNINRLVVPRSQGNEVYKAARKTNWGDGWHLWDSTFFRPTVSVPPGSLRSEVPKAEEVLTEDQVRVIAPEEEKEKKSKTKAKATRRRS